MYIKEHNTVSDREFRMMHLVAISVGFEGFLRKTIIDCAENSLCKAWFAQCEILVDDEVFGPWVLIADSLQVKL